MVLLHLMQSLQAALLSDGIKISAIYINHNLSPSASDWGDFCQSVCLQYKIPFENLSVNAKAKQRQSPEEAARDARYLALKNHLTSSDCLLTAHHQSDQVETVMLQLLRGSGPKGLAAMAFSRDFFHLNLSRPLLQFSRQQIKDYALQHQLQWVEDESNQDLNFKRNFLRHTILPQLQQQWPGMETTLFRVSQLQSETSDILEEVAREDLAKCEVDLENEKKTNSWFCEPMLDRQKLLTLSSARIKNCLQFWLRKNKVAVLTSSLLNQFLDGFIFKMPGAKTQISWKYKNQQFHLRYYQNRLFLSQQLFCKTKIINSDTPLLWNFKNNSQINLGNSQLQAKFSQSQSSSSTQSSKGNSWLDLDKLPETVQINFRQGGELFKKNQHSQHFSLKKWFQEQSIPPWLRSKIPLIYVNKELIQVGYCLVNKEYNTDKEECSVSFLFTIQQI
jgi:tRNA(Ile)-lysidine synthase